MSIRLKILGSIGFRLMALTAVAYVAWDTLETTKITRDRDHQNVLDKDLIANILPAPEYRLEVETGLGLAVLSGQLTPSIEEGTS